MIFQSPFDILTVADDKIITMMILIITFFFSRQLACYQLPGYEKKPNTMNFHKEVGVFALSALHIHVPNKQKFKPRLSCSHYILFRIGGRGFGRKDHAGHPVFPIFNLERVV